MKKIKIHFQEHEYFQAVTKSYEAVYNFNELTKQVEAILKAEIKDLEAFKNDYEGELMRMIKEAYPKPFDLGLDNETTLKMVSIDLNKINELILNLKSNTGKINICKDKKEAISCEDKEPFFLYAETPSQMEKLNFCKQIIEICNKANENFPTTNVAKVASGFRGMVHFDPQTNGLIPSYSYILS